MNKIIPTVFAKNKKDFVERFLKLIKVANNVQIDFMDGKFVKAKSIGLEDVPFIKHFDMNFEAHLMVRSPWPWIQGLKEKGFKKVIFHYESLWDEKKALALINKIKGKEMEAWIALNPGTSIAKLNPLIEKVDGVLLMGHQPGVEHMDFADGVYNKVRHLRAKSRKIKIQVDGGINLDNLERLKELGVNYFNVGSYVAESENPGASLNVLERVLKKNERRV